MAAISSASHDLIAKLNPGAAPDLAHLSDEQLLANTRRIAGTSNQLLAALLAHLAEVEARGIHRTRRCASLYTYCIYELRFSEDAAARRSTAARLAKEFPALLQAVAEGELHLTGLLMIGPHLTPENQLDVLGRAKFRTKKELARLVRELNPLPRVPDVLEPMGPQLPRALRRPTWEQFVTSLAPQVRELPPGERPHDWVDDDPAPSMAGDSGARFDKPILENEPLPLGPVPHDLPPVTGPQQYQVQFSTVEEHAKLVERARALLSHERPGVTLGELHLEAMQLLVASLEKRKFAVTDPRRRGATRTEEAAGAESAGKPPQRSRYIPAAERREVYRRDDARCTYVDERGERCCETHYLELHHLHPFAQNGGNTASNLTLRCAAHNALAAEQDFGSELIAKRRDGARHEPLSAQLRAGPAELPD